MGLDMWLNDNKGKELFYWRKANAIHKWFVENVQNGIDECKDYKVTKEQLKKLLDTISEVLGKTPKERLINHLTGDNFDIEKAKELLPTTDGFFFGGTEYDEDYVEDLIRTKEFLEELLPKLKGKVIYSASW